MTRIILVTCIFATMTMLASCGHHKLAEDQKKSPPSPPNSEAPAPSSDDCMSIVYDIEDCLPYLILDPTADPDPEASCCSAFEKVAKISGCFCLAMKGAEAYGFTLNKARVKGLSGVCKFPAGSQVVSSCLASIAPRASPPGNNPPSSSPELPPPKKSPEPSRPSKSPPEGAPSAPKASPSQNPGSTPDKNGRGKVIKAPAPAPANGGAHATSTSIMALISLLLASFSLALV